MPRSHRPWPAILIALVCALAPRAAAAAPLPRLAVSLPPGIVPAEASRIIDASGLTGAVVVLPAAAARVGSEAVVPASPELLAGRFFLHLALEVGPVPGAGREREALVQRQLDDIVAALRVDRPAVAGVIVEPSGADSPEDVLQFALEMLMVRLKGSNPALEIALVLPEGMADRSFDSAARLMAYADSLVIQASALPGFGASKLEAVAAGKPVMARILVAPGGGPDSAARGWLDFLMTSGASSAATAWLDAADLASIRALVGAVRLLSRSVGADFEMTASERVPLAVVADGQPVSPSVAFVGSTTADAAFLLKTGATRESPRALALSTATAAARTARVTCTDVLGGRTEDLTAGTPPGCRADADYVLLRATVPAAGDRLFEAVRVTGRSTLRVEEIIARWQAARETQRRILDNYSVPCFLGIHFEIANLATSFDVALELRQFVDRSGVQDWVQTAFRVNGVKLRKGQEFPLPQIEPDKMVTRPLELRIDEKYTYELLGTETVDGRRVLRRRHQARPVRRERSTAARSGSTASTSARSA